MRQGNSVKAEYYNRQRVNFIPEPPKRGLKQFHPMSEVDYEPPKINVNHQPGEGIVTKGILIAAYIIAGYLLVLGIACVVASFRGGVAEKTKSSSLSGAFYIYENLFLQIIFGFFSSF